MTGCGSEHKPVNIPTTEVSSPPFRWLVCLHRASKLQYSVVVEHEGCRNEERPNPFQKLDCYYIRLWWFVLPCSQQALGQPELGIFTVLSSICPNEDANMLTLPPGSLMAY